MNKANQFIKKMLASYIFDGIVLILLGVAILIWPENALKILCIVIGVLLGLIGLIRLIIFFVNKSGERKAITLLTGLLQLAAGIAIAVASEFFIRLFFIVIGVILAYGAILMIIQIVRLWKEKGVMFILSIVFAALTLILAVIIFIHPAAFASFMTQLYGASLIVEGLAMLIVLRKLNLNPKKEEPVAES